ncbi:hypothetical protein pb186bvf_014861 [Paramecium bursaria]
MIGILIQQINSFIQFMDQISKIFKGLRIKYQILLVQIFWCVMSLSLFTIVLSIHSDIVKNILIANHNYIQYNRQLVRRARITAHQYQDLMKRQVFQTNKLLVQLNNLYNLSLKDDLILQIDALKCLQEHPNDTIVRNSLFCYGIYGQQFENIKMQKLSKFLSSSLLLMDMNNLYFASQESDQYFSLWPGVHIDQKYVPHKRYWYIQTVKQNDNWITYSAPYLSYNGGVFVTKSILLGKDAVGGIDTDLSQFQFSFQNQLDQPEIMDSTGLLYFSRLYGKDQKELIYFQNSSVTGFTQQDFQQILNLQQNKSVNNTCNFILEGSVCLKDQFGKDYNIWQQQVKYPNYTIIIKIQSQYFEEILNQLFQIFDDLQYTLQTNLMNLFFSVFAVCLVIFCFTIYLIQKPIDKLLECTLDYIKAQKNQKQLQLARRIIIQRNQMDSDSIINLQCAFINLTSSLQCRSKNIEEKNRIELIQYPKMELYLKYYDRYRIIKDQDTQGKQFINQIKKYFFIK